MEQHKGQWFVEVFLLISPISVGSPNSIVAIAASISVVGGLFLCMCPCIIALVCVLVWCFRRNKQEAIKDVCHMTSA